MTTQDVTAGATRKRRSRKWWPAIGAVLGTIAGAIAFFFTIPIYESSTSILIIPQRVPQDFVRSTVTASLTERINMISQLILSRTRLERIIQEFNLYERERSRLIMEDVVEQMRRDISLQISPRRDDDRVSQTSFSIGFKASEPRIAMRVTERLAALFVQENVEDRALLADQTMQFLQGQLEDTRRRLTQSQALLESMRLKLQGRSLPEEFVLEHEILQETYRSLLRKTEEARTALNLERRQIGEQFRVIDGARLPERPIGPSRPPYFAWGALGGLTASVVLTLLSSAWRRRKESRPQSLDTVA
jgi:uncharacterized protein involved in exopolysaccharide biosynthesis